ncbi:MAG: hypothetical protein WAP03_16865 [Methylorubrum rhodinum]|uniref:hypothetical protein n=1 Tax=Methylorubrum rhodinum TaxID=29428 RepID=UPI003BB1C353
MVSLRKATQWTVGLVASGVGFMGLFREVIVKFAEQMGWYDNLPTKFGAAMTWLASIAEPLWFKLLTVFLIGAAAGMWLDAKLKDRETRKDLLDREVVASEAESLARRLGQIAAEGAAREQIAWEEDGDEMMRQGSEGKPTVPTRTRSTAARARTMERYGEYHSEVEAVVAKAQKLISLDRTDLWNMSHFLLSGRDIAGLSRLLARICIELRYPQVDMPVIDRRLEERRRLTQQGGDS